MAFGNREAVLKLEELYWYQTAILLEERRELRVAQAYRTQHPLQPNALIQGELSTMILLGSGLIGYRMRKVQA